MGQALANSLSICSSGECLSLLILLNEERIITTDHPVNHQGLTLFIRHLRQRSDALEQQLKVID